MQAFFLDSSDGGQRFCVHHEALGSEKRGQLLYLHPFAEEMNKSRRMAALQARAFAAAGFDVLQIDLLGCGDSSGDFGDASWQAWLDDVLLGCSWLQARPDPAPLWLWGLRAGSLLAIDALRRLDGPANLLLQQPPASGKPLLQQFLRLKIAGEMIDGASKGLMGEMRDSLSRGDRVEIAGYSLSAALASGLEAGTTQPPKETVSGRIIWLELNSHSRKEWTPVATQAHQRWRDAGWHVSAEAVTGPAFWQTNEIEEAPALTEAALRLLRTPVAPSPAPVDHHSHTLQESA